MQTDANLPGILIQERNDSGLISLCISSGPPSETATAANTFAKGCILQDSTTGESYQNEGTSASPSFVVIQTTASSGDVVGPASAVDGSVAVYDSTTGKLLKDSGFVFPTVDGNAGDMIVTDGSNTLSFTTPNVGDVVGPASAVDGGVVVYDSTTGKLVKDSTFVFPTVDGNAGDVLVTDGSKVLSFSAPSGGITWNEVSGTSQAAAVNNGYIANNGSLVTVTLPDTAAVGDVVRVAGYGAGGWKVAQNASEIIHFGPVDTTTGVGGSLASTNRYDAVELVCTVANLEWVVVTSMGNITIV